VTDYSGVFSIKTLPFSTLLTGNQEIQKNPETQLSGFPNPFSRESKITFDLQNDDRIDLMIYNASGQVVKVLAHNATLQKGNHSYVWQGDNDKGVKVSNGIYVCKLSGATYSSSTKIILMQ